MEEIQGGEGEAEKEEKDSEGRKGKWLRVKRRKETEDLSWQKRSWQIWSGLYNITVEILRMLTIKLTQARTRTRAKGLGIGIGIGLWLGL